MSSPAQAGSASSLPLTGVKVLELGHIVAGPTCGLQLADLGADVIKVEAIGTGDTARHHFNNGSTFYSLNRNKRSLAINLKSDEGRQVFARLVKGADVVIENFAPGTLDRLGIGYEWADQLNPRIIYCSIRGFMPGPNGHRPLLDEMAQMMSGLAYMTGPSGRPLRAGASVIDVGAGVYGAMAINAALFQRHTTGKGQAIVTGLFETAAFLVGQHLAAKQLTHKDPIPFPDRGMGAVMGWGVYRTFQTQDEIPLFIAVTSDKHWVQLCGALGLSEMSEDDRFHSNKGRVENRPVIMPALEAAIGGLDAQTLLARLEETGVPHGLVQSPAALLNDRHLNESQFLVAVPGPEGTDIKLPSTPIWSSAFDRPDGKLPPTLGQDTLAVLEEAGFDQAEIEALRTAGVIDQTDFLVATSNPKS